MKELSKPAQFGIAAAAVLIIGVAIWLASKGVPESGEPSAELKAKQIEYQKSIMPGGGGGRPVDGRPQGGASGGIPATAGQGSGG